MTSYVEGPWFALVTARSVAMLADAPAAALPTLADALSVRGLAGFIDALTEVTGTTVWSLPEFAVAIAEEHGIRVAVRGTLTVTDTSGGRSTTLTGVGVTGWSEAVWEESAAVDIGSAEAPRGGELWIVEGAVRAASVRWSPSAPRALPSPEVISVSPPPVTDAARSGRAQRSLPEEASISSGSVSSVPVPPVEPPDDAEVPAAAPVPTASSEPTGSALQDPADRDDDVSFETLAPAYDEDADGRAEVSHDTVFGSLWGSTVVSPPSRAAGGESSLISAVPEFTSPPPPPPGEKLGGPTPAARPAAPPAAAPAAPAPGQEPVAAQPPEQPSTQPPGDHDGATVSIAALRAMTSGQPPVPAHDASMPSFATAEQLAKEGRGRAVVSTGAVVTLDKSVIVGRTPKASRVTGEMPHLVTVPSPTQDISRSHVELRVEGTAVVAVDLNTTNGTLVRRQGAEPVRLHPGEPHVLLNGDVIEIGDGVTITLEDLP